MIDLRPAPWRVEHFIHGPNKVECWDVTYGPDGDPAEQFSVLEDDNPASYLAMLRFIALARNFLDVQERRGWSCCYDENHGWRIVNRGYAPEQPFHGNPLEAWQWAVDHDAELRLAEKGGA